MLSRRLYYQFKPFLPWGLRIAVRRFRARRIRAEHLASWPILPSAGRTPEGWPGWPDGKQFAFVLTHDVEGQLGLDRVRPLAELEMQLGFRSCFNFIPEGEYEVPRELREWLVKNGFEVGVHDLRHDGKLFYSRTHFRQCATRINHYLRDWNAAGFRAGFMHHNLDWSHDLAIQYDASTFDTDPFEPQPDGVGTIFPFWVPLPQRGQRTTDHGPQITDHRPPITDHGLVAPKPGEGGPRTTDHRSPITDHRPESSNGSPHPRPQTPDLSRRSLAKADPRTSREGYVELPYTLPQDFTLFILLHEKGDAVWRQKLDWIARHGGMALVNQHPDYAHFPGQPPSASTYPFEWYAQFLAHVNERYAGRYWHALPGQVADFVAAHTNGTRDHDSEAPASLRKQTCVNKPIWIDLENTPHIPFFKPIIRELEQRGYRVVVTARDAYQTCEMATRYGYTYAKIGRHYGRNKIFKLWGLFARALQLLPFALREKPCLALNHGSRTQNLVCNLLGIPSVSMMDYEYAADAFLFRSLWELVPSVMPTDKAHCRRNGGIRKYPGIKEDVYVPDFKPDPAILQQLGLQDCHVVVTVRPPATEAHYHNPESEILFESFMNRLCQERGVKAVLLPRSKVQTNQIRTGWPQWFTDGKVIIPDQVVEGLNLLWHSDLVVSGGGTMNREAAALGVPVYSIFRGRIGAVDHHLQAEGRLILIENVQDVQDKIPLQARPKSSQAGFQPRPALNKVVDHLEEILESHYSGAKAGSGKLKAENRNY